LRPAARGYGTLGRHGEWAATVNKYGGDALVIQLPNVGIEGNTHSAFSDLNHVELADHLSAWLNEKRLD